MDAILKNTKDDWSFKGENVLLKPSDPTKSHTLFIQKLNHGELLNSRWGRFKHDEIIGKKVRDVILSHKGAKLRIHRPTLEEYILHGPRCVTPIYPDAANLIVSLLDLHVSSSSTLIKGPPLEILEAGTGNGSLTLYLARAIHAANPKLPPETLAELIANLAMTSRLSDKETGSEQYAKNPTSISEDLAENATSLATSVDEWKSARQAVIHTIELAAHVSKFARNHVSGFRQGMYAGNVDYFNDNLSDWIKQQVSERTAQGLAQGEPFITHAILDLPGAQDHLEAVASVVHTEGVILVFTTHITQLLSCLELSRNLRLPLVLQRAIEIGPGVTGGRDWELGFTKLRKDVYRTPKSREKKLSSSQPDVSESVANSISLLPVEEAVALEGPDGADGDQTAAARSIEEEEDLISKAQDIAKDGELFTICRPKLVSNFMVGGFVGVFRKMAPPRRIIQLQA
ncbi:MAG: hypothetical protein MMC33_000361 [Icmadophila ericetorum]|nr:hypothetical protein [Icmadophila ericetorum]